MADHMRDDDLARREAGIEGTTRPRLVPLEELDDFKVAEGDPDVRGWEVRGPDGYKMGEVKRLIVDPAAQKVRYLEVEMDKSDRRALVPVGAARLNDDTDTVTVSSFDRTRLGGMPAHEAGRYDREYEVIWLNYWRPERDWRAMHERDLYQDDVFDERTFWGNRRRY